MTGTAKIHTNIVATNRWATSWGVTSESREKNGTFSADAIMAAISGSFAIAAKSSSKYEIATYKVVLASQEIRDGVYVGFLVSKAGTLETSKVVPE